MKENNHQHGKDKKYKPITLVPIQMRAEKKKIRKTTELGIRKLLSKLVPNII